MKIKISENQLKKLIQIISEEDDKKLNVLFVGDSLSNGPGYTWNYILAQKRSKEWNSTHITKGGEYTKWMLEQVTQALKEKKYDIVFVYGGTNDMFSLITIKTALSNLKQIIDLVANQGGITYIYSGYDVDSSMPTDLKPTYYVTGPSAGKLLCSKECMENARRKMVKFQKELSILNSPKSVVIPPTDIGKNSFSEQDSVHPNAAAYKMMGNAVDNYIRKNQPGTEESSFYDTLINFKKDNLDTDMVDELLKVLNDFKSKNQKIEYKGTIISSQDVFDIQTGLQLLGYSLPIWGIDGKFGPETERAVKAFKKDLDLSIDGIVDSETINKLIELIKSKNIKNSDFEKLQIEKTSSDTEEFDDKWFPSGKFNSEFKPKINSSIISAFNNVLKTHDLNYSDFENECKAIELDPEIAIKQLWVESIFFNPDVISCKIKSNRGAMGLTQFIPSSWQHYGGGGDPCKPKDALKAYFKFMKELINMFPNRIDLVLAGYNSGAWVLTPDRKKYVYKEAFKNNTPFRDIKKYIPLETQGYVENIISL